MWLQGRGKWRRTGPVSRKGFRGGRKGFREGRSSGGVCHVEVTRARGGRAGRAICSRAATPQCAFCFSASSLPLLPHHRKHKLKPSENHGKQRAERAERESCERSHGRRSQQGHQRRDGGKRRICGRSGTISVFLMRFRDCEQDARPLGRGGEVVRTTDCCLRMRMAKRTRRRR